MDENEELADIFVSTRQLAMVVNLTVERVRQLAIKGMPNFGGQFPLLGCVKWYIKYLQNTNKAEEIIAEELKLKRAKREKVELENKKLQSSLLDVNQVSQQIMQIMQSLKEVLFGLPGRLCVLLENQSCSVIRDSLETEINLVLAQIGEKLNAVATQGSSNDIGDPLL